MALVNLKLNEKVEQSEATRPQIDLVPVDKLHFIWDKVEPLLQKVVDIDCDVTLYSLRNQLVNGVTQLMVVSEGSDILAAMTITVQTMDSGKRVLMCPAIGGERIDEWLEDFANVLRSMGKEYLCDEIRGAGRPGWERKAKSLGLKPIMTVFNLGV